MSHNYDSIILAWLCKWRLKNGWSMLTTDTFMADKADARQGDRVAAAEVLVRVWWQSVVVLPPTPFVLEGAAVFKRGDNMVGGEMSRFLAGMDHPPWLMWQAQWDFFKQLFYHFLGCLSEGQWKAHRTEWSWRCFLPNTAGTSLAYPWSPFVQGPQYW